MNAVTQEQISNPVIAPALSLVPTPPADQGELAGMPQADIDALAKAKEIEAKRVKEGGMVRFQSAFILEGEKIGEAKPKRGSQRYKTSKGGAVTLGLLPLNSKTDVSLSSVSGFKGEELKAYGRLESDALKSEEAQIMTRLAGDTKWTGHSYTLNSKGNEVTFKLRKVEAMSVSVTKELTEAELLAKLGLTAEEYAPIKAAKAAAAAKAAEAWSIAAEAAKQAELQAKAKETIEALKTAVEEAIAPEDKEAKELAELERQIKEEEERIAQSASKNGEVEQVNPAE